MGRTTTLGEHARHAQTLLPTNKQYRQRHQVIGFYWTQYTRMQLWSLATWVFGLLLITYQWVLYYVVQFCQIRGITGGATNPAAPANFQNVTPESESLCGSRLAGTWPASTLFMVSYIVGACM